MRADKMIKDNNVDQKYALTQAKNEKRIINSKKTVYMNKKKINNDNKTLSYLSDLERQYGLSIFHFRQKLDKALIDGIVLTIIILSVITPTPNGAVSLSILISAIFVMYFYEKIFNSKSFKELARYGAGEFQGNIDSLILAFAEAGLFLDKQVGGRYIFKSRNFIVPNTNFIVKELQDNCLVVGSQRDVRNLEEFFTNVRV
jgi:hypothetical protein